MGTTGQSITLANSIIGVGILAMPFCFQQCGVLLAALILLSMGLVSRLCCYFLLKSALIARRRNFEFLAFHVFGPAGKLAVEVGIIGFLMGTCIAYFVVVGDLGPQIIAKMFNINQSDILRTSIMVIVSLVCVLPLGLLRNVDSLSNVSAATIAFYFCLVIKVTAEATSQLWSGDWRSRVEMWKPSGLLQCVPIFSMALFCQTQLFEIFESLPTLSLEKMNVVTKTAINICTSVYFTLGIFGYVAFAEKNISGNILMSLSPTMTNDVIKLGFVMSLAFSFPLIIFPCRASLYSFLFKKAQKSHHDHIIHHSIPETTFRCITVAIIAVALFVSLLLPNIELVLGLLGSTIGVMICVVFPAACFVNVTFKDTNERVLAKGIVVLGLIIMVLGTYANLQAAETKLDRYDDKYFTQERIDKMVEDFFESKKIEVNVKPLDVKESLVQGNINKGSKEIISDSEIQPPNPVPPESQSNENKIAPENNKKLKELPEVKTDTASKSHPKNLKTKLNEVKLSNSNEADAKLINGDQIETNDKDKPKEKDKEPTIKEVKAPPNEEKNDIMKQQQLIETIKQHGKEQKELIKEQKQILNELIKTKKELQQNKKEVGSVEAKKIAVESIQKIANMAIQSLSGVSEKPRQVVNEVLEPIKDLEKTANEAVQEIAKKAVETIEAINEVKEKKDTVPSNQGPNNDNLQPVNNQAPTQNVQTNVQNGHIMQDLDSQKSNNVNIQNPVEAQNSNPLGIQNRNNVPANNIQPSNKVQADVKQNVAEPLILNNPPMINVNDAHSNNIQPNLNANVMQPVTNNYQPVSNRQSQQPNAQMTANKDGVINQVNPHIMNQPIQNPNITQQILNNVQANLNSNVNNPPQPVANEPIINQKSNAQVVSNNITIQQTQSNNTINTQSNSQIKQNLIEKQSNDKIKEHVHSADEPESYKEGEDLQKKMDEIVHNNVAQNVPLALGMNGNAQSNKDIEDIEVKVGLHNQEQNAINLNNVQNGVQEIGPPVNTLNNNDIQDNLEHSRQKREAVDCTENTLSFKAEYKEICKSSNPALKQDETLSLKVDLNKVSLLKIDQEILAKVDLNEIILPKSLSLDGNIIHHISRSLKNYDETER